MLPVIIVLGAIALAIFEGDTDFFEEGKNNDNSPLKEKEKTPIIETIEEEKETPSPKTKESKK
jgi:hypothetical protein